jgi:protein arginine N-methyltransferase 1
MSGIADAPKDGEAPESTDFANYFCTYGFIYHQKDMLEDHKRTGAYYHAVMNNRKQFEGKVVLDVGTGSGILALFAAKAGAKKVYAVEATNMAKLARRVVENNGMSDIITVIQGMVESVTIPEQVDIIISEWMGYFLLRESMLDSVLLARDRFLKPGGAMYPSHARMYFAPIRTNSTAKRVEDYESSKENWEYFNSDMKAFYGVDLGSLTEDFDKEQRDYFINSTAWQDVHPSQVVGQPMCFKTYDLGKVSISEIQDTITASCTLPIQEPVMIEGLCSWFDVQFAGSPENPADETVLLSTAPDATGSTHWGQQTFFLSPPIDAAGGDALRLAIEINRKKENHRLMGVSLKYKLQGSSRAASVAKEVSKTFHIE